MKDMAELESAKQEGLVVERAYKALRRSYDTKMNQEKALLARLQERWQVPEMGDMFTWRGPFPVEKSAGNFGRICPRNFCYAPKRPVHPRLHRSAGAGQAGLQYSGQPGQRQSGGRWTHPR